MSSWRKIREQASTLGRSQQDQVTRAQLLRLGLGCDAITYEARHGALYRVHQGVFSLVAPPLNPLQRASSAVLACAPDGALCGLGALALWWPGRPWPDVLSIAGTARRIRPGLDVRQIRGLTRVDVRVHHGMRVTSPARTLLDCAAELGWRATGKLLADGRRAGLIHPASLDDVLERFPRHCGHATLTKLVDDPAGRARSEFEIAFPRFCAEYALPVPLINVHVHGRERDAYFPDQRLIVELDGWDYHRDRVSFEDDRERDAEALAAELATYRLTTYRLKRAPAREAQRLARILVSRGWSPAERSAPGL